MKTKFKYGSFVINVMIACALTIIVNMSFLLFANELNMRKVPLPFPSNYMWIQMGYTFLMAFVSITITTSKRLSFLKKVLIITPIIIGFFMLTPTYTREGEWVLLFKNPKPIQMHHVQMLNSLFVLVVSLLYGKIYELVFQKQRITIENEMLKNENLQTRYDMLASQISPHFLFNSLNSLSMLVREDEKDKALHYIAKLSDTFRYVLQTGQSELTTLADELHFTDAYMYLHMIRYEGKLFCDMDIDPCYLSYKLPSVSLQPLIENAVKHNTITMSDPLRISIRTVDGKLVISNPMRPKLEKEEGTGIGLKNLASRYSLLTGREIEVRDNGGFFEVILPLIK